jgi:hypothetical protein
LNNFLAQGRKEVFFLGIAKEYKIFFSKEVALWIEVDLHIFLAYS